MISKEEMRKEFEDEIDFLKRIEITENVIGAVICDGCRENLAMFMDCEATRYEIPRHGYFFHGGKLCPVCASDIMGRMLGC